jgi:hypothetical protein
VVQVPWFQRFIFINHCEGERKNKPLEPGYGSGPTDVVLEKLEKKI